ncbi:hypothetical protein, partial [Streptomyces himastatinicus]|uniref:hypothetical protein n=1 Tax=Streptomyces himastatinicus TaxID=998084 RepID=UPI001AD8487D
MHEQRTPLGSTVSDDRTGKLSDYPSDKLALSSTRQLTAKHDRAAAPKRRRVTVNDLTRPVHS